ncbi:hypothetical protein PybrP1_005430 [[Pythium] brassicae (nom. inval.)]|nr:hypothetical protein PybrP1_005430 [[Pythium] brassicae (nom. inval.)]
MAQAKANAGSNALSKVVLEKLLRDELSDSLALQKETLEWLGDCASVFVRRVGSEANAIAASGAKKENYRVSADHVLQALERLGKRAYADVAREQLEAHAEQTQRKKEKRQRAGANHASAGESHAELLAAQNALFKQASLRATKEGW